MSKSETLTHNVGLWLDNDEGLYNSMIELAREHTDRLAFSRALKAYFEDNAPKLSEPYNDLLRRALELIDWWELSESFEEFIGGSEEEE